MWFIPCSAKIVGAPKILLSILGFGLLISIIAFVLLLLPKEFIKTNICFITPLPPIAVAVYVYVSRTVTMDFQNIQSIFFEIFQMSLFVFVVYFVLSVILWAFLKSV